MGYLLYLHLNQEPVTLVQATLREWEFSARCPRAGTTAELAGRCLKPGTAPTRLLHRLKSYGLWRTVNASHQLRRGVSQQRAGEFQCTSVINPKWQLGESPVLLPGCATGDCKRHEMSLGSLTMIDVNDTARRALTEVMRRGLRTHCCLSWRICGARS